jgi:hypothetical protein
VDHSATVPDRSIRVVLAELPTMVAALVRDAVRGEGIVVLEELRSCADLAGVLERRDAQVLIVPAEASGVAPQYHEMLGRVPGLRVLTIAAVPHSTDLYELRLLGNNVGRSDVVAAIRGVMAEDYPKAPAGLTRRDA